MGTRVRFFNCFHLVTMLQILATFFAVPACFSFGNETSSFVTISYLVPNAGRVSLAIYDIDGRMVRTLLTGVPKPAGHHVAHWDGLDRYGKALPTGRYQWKLVTSTGLRAEYLMQIGQNTDPIWERATGNHEAPIGAAIDTSGLYRVGATNEGGHYAVKTSLNGKHLWAVDRYAADPWAQGTVAVTLVNDRLFELMPNGDVYGYDAASGKVFTGGILIRSLGISVGRDTCHLRVQATKKNGNCEPSNVLRIWLPMIVPVRSWPRILNMMRSPGILQVAANC